jgi:Flp pilus assembly protein CpaB
MTTAWPVASGGGGAGRWLREVTRAVSWHRRLLSAGLLAGAVALGISAVSPPPPTTVGVLTVARDLAGGAVIRAADVRVARFHPDTVPAGALGPAASPVGRVLAAPVRRGEPLTDVRLVGRPLLRALGPGLVATPVRLADGQAAALLQPGDVVDVLAAGPALPGRDVAPQGRLVASAVRVLTVPRTEAPFGGGGEGGLVVLATRDDTASRLASAAASERLSVTIRGD